MQESSSYKLVEILSPEKYRELQRLLDLKTGDNVRHGCGKYKCPCPGVSGNCPKVVDREAQALRLKTKPEPVAIQEFCERYEVDWSMPFVLCGA